MKAYAENASLDYRYYLSTYEREIGRVKSRSRREHSRIAKRRRGSQKPEREGCGPFFSFFAARRPPLARSLNEPDRWRRSHCAESHCVEFEGMYTQPILHFPFFFRIAFPSFSHTAAPTTKLRLWEREREEMLETRAADQICITLTRYKSVWLTKNDRTLVSKIVLFPKMLDQSCLQFAILLWNPPTYTVF